jgi:hypothetical protein
LTIVSFGIGARYPNGRETRTIGIMPDIEVRPTLERVGKRNNEVLENPIEVIVQ